MVCQSESLIPSGSSARTTLVIRNLLWAESAFAASKALIRIWNRDSSRQHSQLSHSKVLKLFEDQEHAGKHKVAHDSQWSLGPCSSDDPPGCGRCGGSEGRGVVLGRRVFAFLGGPGGETSAGGALAGRSPAQCGKHRNGCYQVLESCLLFPRLSGLRFLMFLSLLRLATAPEPV